MRMEMKRRPYCTLSSCPSTRLKDSLLIFFFFYFSLILTYFSLFKLWLTPSFLPLTFFFFFFTVALLICLLFCQLYFHTFFLDYTCLFKYCSHIVPLFFASLVPLDVNISASSTSSSLHLLLSISSTQLYDLGSPADSQSSSPGCLTTDSSCVNMGYPSCGHRGRCHGEWGSFSCQCVPGYTGHQCEEGELIFIDFILFILFLFFVLVYLRIKGVLDCTTSKWWQNNPCVHERYFTPLAKYFN